MYHEEWEFDHLDHYDMLGILPVTYSQLLKPDISTIVNLIPNLGF